MTTRRKPPKPSRAGRLPVTCCHRKPLHPQAADFPPAQQQKRTTQGQGLPSIERFKPKVTNLRQILHPTHYAQLLGMIGRSPTPRRPSEGVVKNVRHCSTSTPTKFAASVPNVLM